MTVMKKLLAVGALLLLAVQLSATARADAAERTVNLYFFWSQGCPHCLAEKQFLKQLEKKYPYLRVRQFDTADRDNLELLRKAAALFNVSIAGVPFTFIGNDYFVGWYDEATTGAALENALRKAWESDTPDPMAALIIPAVPSPGPKGAIPEIIKVPLLGELAVKQLSLGALTIIIGALDGFNPCAMWVLILLLGLLLGMENSKQRWILGTSFIAASALVYFLIMVAWLNLFLFLGFLVWVRIIIALVALGAGFYNLREYFTAGAAVCKVTGGGKGFLMFDRVKEFVHRQSFWLALGGIIILAFAVNLVELVCSAGFPVVYLQVLSLTPLPSYQYYLYILLYIFIFMLDDLIVFFGAMITFQVGGMSTRYKKYSNLIGGCLMLLLGILLIFKPEALMFG
jgi:thiol-disulfide isomerase/thioredoxin